MLTPCVWHALHLLHLYCIQLCARTHSPLYHFTSWAGLPIWQLRSLKKGFWGWHIRVHTTMVVPPPPPQLWALQVPARWVLIIEKYTQQDYYGRRCGTPLHSYCTSTYTEVTVLLLWSSSNATFEYLCRYSNRVALWVLHGKSRITSQEQHGYFSVGTSVVTV